MAIMEKKFNLLEEPWIRVLTPEQIVWEVSLTDALVNAHRYVGLAGELPTQDIAILRLLLAVLYAVFSRVDADGDECPLESEDDALDRWAELWETGKFPKEPVAEYLNQWRERFWLFHPERPFYQVPEATVGTSYSSAKLIGTVSQSGSDKEEQADKKARNPRLFPNRLGSHLQKVGYGEAARWLIYINAFDDSSAKPKYTDEEQKSGKKYPSLKKGWLGSLGLIYAEGSSLFETLMLNFTLLRDGVYEWGKGVPVWELPLPRSEQRALIPLPDNPASLFTLQSRRLFLHERDGYVRGYSSLGGDFFEEENAFSEQMTVWKYNKDKTSESYSPQPHAFSKQVWREFSSIAGTKNGKQLPGVVRWISKLKEINEEFTNKITHVRFNTASVRYDKKGCSVTNIIVDNLTFHASLLKDMAKPLRERVEKEISLCDEIAKKVGNFASDLEIASGGDGKAGRENGVERYYDRIDQPFRAWLAGLNPEAEDVAREDALNEWRKKAFDIARQVGEELVEQAGRAAFVGRDVVIDKAKNKKRHYSAPEAYNWFSYALRELDG